MPDVDIEQPAASRIYDFLLGGAHHFAADRRAAHALIAAAPHIITIARANRDFLRRAVRYALREGIGQFLDLGAGFPVRGSVHRIVQSVHPAARVVYVDADPVAVALAQRILVTNPAAGVVGADIRDIVTILHHPETLRLIDFTHPVCVLAACVLHHVADDLTATMTTLKAALSPGSLLVVSHATTPAPPHAGQFDAVRQIYARTATPLHLRTPEEITALLTGLDLVPAHDDPHRNAPGLVPVHQWRPDTHPCTDGLPTAPRCGLLAAVAAKP
jgi:SAM-dependent methyltransferase